MLQSTYYKNIDFNFFSKFKELFIQPQKSKILKILRYTVYHISMLWNVSFPQQKQTHVSSIPYFDISTWCYMSLLKRKSRTHWLKGTLSQLPVVSPTALLRHTTRGRCDLHHARSLQWSPSHRIVWEQNMSKLLPVTERI